MSAEISTGRGFILSRHSRDSGAQTELSLWLHTTEGPAKLCLSGEQPLFFIPQSEQHAARGLLSRLQIAAQITPLSLKTFDQQAVCGVYLATIQAHQQAHAALQAAGIPCFETDIRLHERFLMERYAFGSIAFNGQPIKRKGYTEYRQVRLRGEPAEQSTTPRFSVLSLDIECSAEGELYSVGLHSNSLHSSAVAAAGPKSEGESVARVVMIGQPQPAATDIRWVRDERQLLSALCDEINRLDPDVLIGWNLVDFDLRLLCQRAEKYAIALRIGRGGSAARWRDSQQTASDAPASGRRGFLSLPGRVAVDGISALKNASWHFDSYSLQSVSHALLGRGKKMEAGRVDDRLREIMHNFQHDKPALAAYNLEDCRLVSEIFSHTRLLEFLCLRSTLTGLSLDRNGGSVAAFTNLYLPRLHRSGYIAPDRPADGGLASPGGYVMDSRPGLYKNVLVLDFKSLYPSIIRTFKIDPLGLIEGLQAPDEAIEGYLGGCFSRDRHFLPEIITQLWQQRDQAKQENDQARSQAIKILMNSFYGVLGSGGCRFYDQRLASSITLRGHAIMKQTAAWIEATGHRVIYGDTDSIFVHLSQTATECQADETGKQLARDINQRWQEKIAAEHRLTSCLELEYESHFQRFLMPTIRGSDAGSKKRYAGLLSNGELMFKGLETVRSDWTPLAKRFQQQLYQLVFSDQDPSEYIRQTVSDTLNGNHDELLIFSKRLRRPLADYIRNVPPHVRAARLANQHCQQQGKPEIYRHRSRISYLWTVSGPQPAEFQTSAIDYQAYVDKQLLPIADAILPFIGLSFSALTDAQLDLF